MFCYQDNQYFSPAEVCSREKFHELLDSADVKWKIETLRSARLPGAIEKWGSNSEFQKFCLKEAAKKKTGEAFQALTDEEKLCRWANNLKESLPCLIFGGREFDEKQLKKDKTKVMRRRLLASIHLSGLFMFDADHIDNPREVYERTQVEGFPWVVVFAHNTSSGKGLRIVSKARPEIGNIADNQIELARALGVKADASCIDASRISYVPRREDVYFLDEDELFNYYGEEFAQKYEEEYRQGHTEPTDKTHSFDDFNSKEERSQGVNPPTSNLQSQTSNLNLTYHGIEYKEICEAWQTAQGGAPATGDRHRTMLQLALDLRYICDNLCRTSSGNEATRKSRTLLIRLVSESFTRTSPRGCKGCLKVWVFTPASPTELQSLWEQLKCLMSSSLKGWSLSFAPLMPKPARE